MAETFDRAICWLRRDLRLSDHAALGAATEASALVAVVFVFDTTILKQLKDRDDRRLTFIYRSLEEIDAGLRTHGSRLVILHGDPAIAIPKLAAEMKVQSVFAARDYEPYAVQRDASVEKALTESGVSFKSIKDSVVLEPGELMTKGGTPFRVYTPYSRAWHQRFSYARDAEDRAVRLTHTFPRENLPAHTSLEDFPIEKLGFEPVKLWLAPGEKAGKARLDRFEGELENYQDARNFPAKNGTSGLSAHLRFGTISVRACVRSALAAGSKGRTWLGELIWRDFFQDVLWHHPFVAERPFQPQYEHIQYPGTDAHFDAWCNGRTGYPLVDAAMRHFNETGWMHNRLRMVVASFLTKDLLVDYRRGESYFARYLLDFDLASNNGNWQWAASTGCDAQPYFRIFNPITQSEKFDPDGEFIRSTIPELRELEGPAIHFPSRGSQFELEAARVKLGENYPEPIVDHATQREKAIHLLAMARK